MTPIVRIALEEDIGTGDVTTRACVPESQQAHGRFLAREPLIVAGLALCAVGSTQARVTAPDNSVEITFLRAVGGPNNFTVPAHAAAGSNPVRLTE